MPNKNSSVNPDPVEQVVSSPVRSMLITQWIHEYGQNKYKKYDLNIFKYKADKHRLNAFTPSEWDDMFKGIKPMPKMQQ